MSPISISGCRPTPPGRYPRPEPPPAPSHREGISLRRLAAVPHRCRLQRFERTRLIEVQDRIELRGQAGGEVVADALRLRPVDDADRPFEARLAHESAALLPAQRQQEARDARLVEERLDAAGQAGAHALPLGGPVPI